MLTARLEKRVRDLVSKKEEERKTKRKKNQRNRFLPSARAIKKLCADIESRGFTRADVKRCVLDALLEDDEDDEKEWKNNDWVEKCFDRLLMQLERQRLPRAFRGGAVASTNTTTEGEDLEKVLVVTVEKPKVRTTTTSICERKEDDDEEL